MRPRDRSEALFAASPHQSVMMRIRRLVEKRTDQPVSRLSWTSATPARSCTAVSSQLRNSNVKNSKIGVVAHRCGCRFYDSVTPPSENHHPRRSSRPNVRGFSRNGFFPLGGRSSRFGTLWRMLSVIRHGHCRAIDLDATDRVRRDRSIFGEQLRKWHQSAPDSDGARFRCQAPLRARLISKLV